MQINNLTDRQQAVIDEIREFGSADSSNHHRRTLTSLVNRGIIEVLDSGLCTWQFTDEADRIFNADLYNQPRPDETDPLWPFESAEEMQGYWPNLTIGMQGILQSIEVHMEKVYEVAYEPQHEVNIAELIEDFQHTRKQYDLSEARDAVFAIAQNLSGQGGAHARTATNLMYSAESLIQTAQITMRDDISAYLTEKLDRALESLDQALAEGAALDRKVFTINPDHKGTLAEQLAELPDDYIPLK